jgi:hypothetical protein
LRVQSYIQPIRRHFGAFCPFEKGSERGKAWGASITYQ